MLLDQVLRTILRYSMFAPEDRVAVAVSGGADSVCLLHVLHSLAYHWNLKLSVMHVNHGLRGGESDEDARFVERLAASFGLDCRVYPVDLSAGAGNLEQAARDARRRAFHDAIQSRAIDKVATGHTRSDQAETVLYRFLRGSGTAGLAGVLPVTREGVVRPLLDSTRLEIQHFLEEQGIAWREDSSNQSRDFARNRIRHDLLPMLTQQSNPQLPETLANAAEVAQDEEDWWYSEIAARAQRLVRSDPDANYMRASELTGLHPAVARRLVRHILAMVKGDLRQIDFAHVERIRALAANPEGHDRLQVPGVDVLRSFDWIRFARPGLDSVETRNYRFAIDGPATYPIPGGNSIVSIEICEPGKCGYTENVAELDREKLTGSLSLRNWRPGDQYLRTGRDEVEKLKLLFQAARVPLWERRHWPIITCEDAIVWTKRFGTAAGYGATRDSKTILRVRESGETGEDCHLT